MLSLLWLEQQFGVVAFLLVLVGIALSNLRHLAPLVRKRLTRTPRVSVLVPARDEAANIEALVRSLAAQDYPDFEVIVLDDRSTDETPALLARLQSELAVLRVITGTELPAGWLGKQWACDQLARAATGELLLFTDADTRHAPGTLSALVAAFEAGRLDLLSAVPREETVGWAEKLVVPVVPWAILAFLPLGLAYRWRRPAFSAANGQFLAFTRAAYGRVGGHAAVRASVVDDIALARRAAGLGLRWRLCDAQDLVRCRMYRTSREVFDGFSKNLFGAFGYRLAPFLFVWLWLGVVTFQPLVVLGRWAGGAATPALSVGLALAAVASALALWGVSNAKFRFPWYVTLAYPAVTALAFGIAVRSVAQALTGRAQWKGRRLPGRVRW
ncbi:MAG: glycosyltransferase [bacterium]